MVMENFRELLDILERDEEFEEGEQCQDYHAYKVAAIQCENKLAEQRRLKHKKLLNKVAELDRTLKQKKSMGKKGTDSVNSKSTSYSHKSHEGSLDKNFNYVNTAEQLDNSKELLDTVSRLSDLKSQEKALEDWYGTMSDRLQHEQMKLKDNFNEMKLKILRKRQQYLKSSEEFISNLSNESLVEKCSLEKARTVLEQNSPAEEDQNMIMTSNGDGSKSQGSVRKEASTYDSEHTESVQKSPQVEDYSRKGGNISTSSLNDLGERTLGISSTKSQNDAPVRNLMKTDFIEEDIQAQDQEEIQTDVKDLAVQNASSSTLVSEIECTKEKEAKVDAIYTSEVYIRLGAVAKGYITRKLMATIKVQELIKTIKDTKAFLADMKNEDRNTHKKLHEKKADQLLSATVQQEMQNARSKIHDIFMVYSSKQQMELIARSRRAAIDRQKKLSQKDKKVTSSQGKRLLNVSQRRQKKQEQDLPVNDDSEARPQSSASLEGDLASRKQRKSWDVRYAKPVPSNGSPFHYTKNRDRTINQQMKDADTAEHTSQDVASTKPTKSTKRKVLAATLNRRM